MHHHPAATVRTRKLFPSRVKYVAFCHSVLIDFPVSQTICKKKIRPIAGRIRSGRCLSGMNDRASDAVYPTAAVSAVRSKHGVQHPAAVHHFEFIAWNPFPIDYISYQALDAEHADKYGFTALPR